MPSNAAALFTAALPPLQPASRDTPHPNIVLHTCRGQLTLGTKSATLKKEVIMVLFLCSTYTLSSLYQFLFLCLSSHLSSVCLSVSFSLGENLEGARDITSGRA